MQMDYWILAFVAVIGVGSGLFLLRTAKDLPGQKGASDSGRTTSNPILGTTHLGVNQQVMEEIRRQIIVILRENPWLSADTITHCAMTASQVHAVLVKPLTPLSAGSLIQLALALRLPVRIVLDVPAPVSEDIARDTTAASSDGRAIDNRSGRTPCEK